MNEPHLIKIVDSQSNFVGEIVFEPGWRERHPDGVVYTIAHLQRTAVWRKEGNDDVLEVPGIVRTFDIADLIRKAICEARDAV